jgi:putative ABC transport system substrate-binding protein
LSASAFTQARRPTLVKDSLNHQLPGIFYEGEFVAIGGLMSYAATPEIYRRAAATVDKILRGANPGDLPTEQPTSFELTINLKTAESLGTIPNSLQVRADRLFK